MEAKNGRECTNNASEVQLMRVYIIFTRFVSYGFLDFSQIIFTIKRQIEQTIDQTNQIKMKRHRLVSWDLNPGTRTGESSELWCPPSSIIDFTFSRFEKWLRTSSIRRTPSSWLCRRQIRDQYYNPFSQSQLRHPLRLPRPWKHTTP